MLQGLQPEHRVLDVGSGIGNLALGLIGYLRGGYDGVEIHKEAVEWCQRAITPHHPQFRFHRADIVSRAYNPHGGVPAGAYRFPFPDHSFDFILLASVFTHMLPDQVEHYMAEIARLLKPGGVCVASYFLLNDESRAGVEAGRSFMTFDVPHTSGVCRLHNQAVPEAAVAFEETFVRAIHQRVGLRVRDLRRGGWWSGVAHDQDVLAVTPNVPPSS
jgi:SAM-dependent methyltransferase